jgi:MFS family permease
VQFTPVLLSGGWPGVVADRFDNRKAVMVVQSLLGLQAAILATVVLTHSLQLWMVYVLAAVQGLGTAFDTPPRQSLVGQLVSSDELSNAVSLNAGLAQAARVVGPAIAGALITWVGIGACFALNAASYCVVIALVTRIDPSSMVHRPRVPAGKGQARAAIGFAFRAPELRNALVMALVIGVFASNFNVTIPLLVKEGFHRDAGVYSLIAMAQGMGALVAAIALATRKRPTKRFLLCSSAGLGIALALTAAAPVLLAVVAPVAVMGGMGAASGIGLNASLQLGAPPAMRGRIIAMFFYVMLGTNVIGGPLMGWIAEWWSPRAPFLTGAIAMGVLSTWVWTMWRGSLDEAAAGSHT